MKILINNLTTDKVLTAYSYHTYLTTNGDVTEVILEKPTELAELIEDDKSIFFEATETKDGLELTQNDAFKFGADSEDSEALLSKFSVTDIDGVIYRDEESFSLGSSVKSKKK